MSELKKGKTLIAAQEWQPRFGGGNFYRTQSESKKSK